ncbi:MAG: domain S-box [Acidobacteria bacterium]|nr:domain S-box [Acidobacteriota bacterium]
MPDDSGNSTTLAARSKVFSRGAAVFVMLVAGLVLCGWLLDSGGLKRIYGEITMKANTAICLLLAAASVWTLPRRTQSSHKAFGELCALAAGVIGFLTLVEHFTGWNLRIDQLIFTEAPGALATTSPGRMGFTSSSCFTMFGAALILLYRRRAISTAQVLSLIAGFWALLAVIGYVYQAQALFGIARYTGIAFPTALTLFILCLGILAASLDEGVLSIVGDETAAGIMSRRLLTVAIIVPITMGWLLLAGQRAGYFDLGFGTSLLVSIIILIFLLSIWRAAVRLRHIEQQRQISEDLVRDERHKSERAQALLAGIVESSEDAIISKTLDGIIDSWNAAAERLFEYSANEAVGNPVTLIIPPERLSEEQMILKRLRQGERVEHFETVRVSKTGRLIEISLMISPIRNQQGEIIGASKIARDITDRRQAEQERERLLLQERSLRAEAERATRLKDEFLATVSHELRTPLNAILGWVSMLRKGLLDKATADRGIEAIERNAKSQAQLIEDLLDVTRIISGNLRLDVKPISLTSVVKSAMDSVQVAADAKQIRLQIIIDPVGDHVKGDAERVQQIIWNLLSNSIKFTPPCGQVTVTIDRFDSMAQVTVKDTGEGISAEFLPFVFDRFKQADGSTTRKHGGLGLGLAIARNLMEMHGGTIEASSPGRGLGATFQIRLPMASPIPTAAVALESARTTIIPDVAGGIELLDLRRVRILAVDDEPDAREMLRVALEGFGADVTTVSSAQEALDILPIWRPDILVSDIGMPDEDGYTLIRKIRELPLDQRGDIPAIALTGYVRVEERMRALAAGYQMFVPKPVEIGELIATIVSLIGSAESLKLES